MLEIERKFLVDVPDPDRLRGYDFGTFEQGYLITGGAEFRIRTSGTRYKAAVKMGKGLTRHEYEFQVPTDVGQEMLQHARETGWTIEKTRFHVPVKLDTRVLEWEIDQFHGKHAGLWIAEVEFKSESEAALECKLPGCVRARSEVTDDPAFKNAELAKRGWEPKGYHFREITKGSIGAVSKVREELEELEDAAAQNNKILQLVELSDLYGAVEAVARTLGVTIDDVAAMSAATERAFRLGERAERR